MLHDTSPVVSPAFNNANGDVKTENEDASGLAHVKTENVLPPTSISSGNVLIKDELNGESQRHQHSSSTPIQHPANGFPTSSPGDFMQHQSQIYVFSTDWANKAADGVETGLYKTILAYHFDQKETKSMLQKMPNIQPPPMSMSMTSMSGPMPMPLIQTSGVGSVPGPSPSPSSLQMSNYMQANVHQSKVPTENLTPEQRAHREEQLANLRNLQKMLCPEQQQNHSGMIQSGPMMITSSGSMPPFNSGPSHMPIQRPVNWEHLPPAQREWHKLQQDFYMEKFKRGPGPTGSGQFQTMRPMSPQIPHSQMPLSPASNGQFSNMRSLSPMMSNDMPLPPQNGPILQSGDNHSPIYSSCPPNMMGPPMPISSMTEGIIMHGDMIAQHHQHPHMQSSANDFAVFQRVGNPDQLKPSDLVSTTESKPPPSYAAVSGGESNNNNNNNNGNVPLPTGIKRKRSAAAAELDDKKLQPAPSPKQFSYLTQFDGQELTITKQLNSAFKDSNGEDQQSPIPPMSHSSSPATPRSPIHRISTPSTPIPAQPNTPSSSSLSSIVQPPTPNYNSGCSSSMTYTSNAMTGSQSYTNTYLSTNTSTMYTNQLPKMTNITSASLAALADLATKAPQSVAPPQERTPTPRSISPNVLSPGVRHSNANVHVQAKAPNTIQYLPANPPTSNPQHQMSMMPQQQTNPHQMSGMMGGGEALMSTIDFDQGPPPMMMQHPSGQRIMEQFPSQHHGPMPHHLQMQNHPSMYMRGGPPPHRQGGPPVHQQQMHMHPMHHQMMHGERFNGDRFNGPMFY